MRSMVAIGVWCVIAVWMLLAAVGEWLMGLIQRRAAQVLLVVLALMIALAGVSCGRKQATAPVVAPAPTVSSYVRLATYNAIVAEANLALAKSVRTAADVQLLTPTTTREIFAWQREVARTSKELALLLSDSAIDIRSPQVLRLVAELATPVAVDRWLKELTRPEQQIVVAAIRTLASTLALVMQEFVAEERAALPVRWRAPGPANCDAWLASQDAERVLRVAPRRGGFDELATLWKRRALGMEAMAGVQ